VTICGLIGTSTYTGIEIQKEKMNMKIQNVFMMLLIIVIAAPFVFADSTNEIVISNYTYASPTVQDVDKWWDRIHFLSETMHRPDGAWGNGYSELFEAGFKCNSSHPLVRQTAHAVMGYTLAYNIYKNETYKERAIGGLEWLLDEQLKTGYNAGAFQWYCTATDIELGEAGMYETGLAGKALMYGYREFNDTRYLASARSAALWESRYVSSWNHNINAFAVSFLTEYYRTTGEQFALDRSIYLAKTMIAKQNSEGYFDDIYGHNKIAYYHEIITRSFIELLSVMPENHTDRPVIKTGTFKAINYIGTHQNADGSMWMTPTDASPNDEEYSIDGLGMAYTELEMPVLNILNGLTNFYMNMSDIGIHATGIPSGRTWKEPFEQKPVIAGYMVQFINRTSTPIVTPVPTPNLIAYWDFNEGNGTIAKDIINKNDINLINNPTWINGKIGNALLFDGINDYAIKTQSPIVFGQQFTWIGYVNSNSDTSLWRDLFRIDGSFAIQLTKGTGALNFEITGLRDIKSPIILTSGVWTHLAIVRDGPIIKFYKDGSYIYSESTTFPIVQGTGTTYISDVPNVQQWFKGSMDEIKVYNRALSNIEINEDYNSINPMPTQTPEPTEIIPTPEPTEITPTPEPTEITPTPEPTEIIPTPEPTEIIPTPEPTEITPTPEPTEIIPTTEPTEITPTTEPTEITPTPEPTEITPTPEPTEIIPTPEPTEITPTPEPTEITPTPEPTEIIPTPEP
jgi:hypothetical protein